MRWLGLDIGGANLKVANANGWARSMPFALWRNPGGLTAALMEIIAQAPAFDRLAVTMTGELCDCYRSKSEGVPSILASVRQIAADEKIAVYLTNGGFTSVSAALERPLLAAASNWRAIAELACRYVAGGDALVIDIGSTTTDIVPIVNGQVATESRTDTQRLLAHELVYSGVGRTPICALVQSLPLRSELCPVAAELFSTTADAYLLLGDMPENPFATCTADGRPLAPEFARVRLARQVCADADAFRAEELYEMAAFIRSAQQSQVANACRRVAGKLKAALPSIVIAGEGEFLARAAAAREFPGSPIASLADHLGLGVSQAAAAYALAVLAEAAFLGRGKAPRCC